MLRPGVTTRRGCSSTASPYRPGSARDQEESRCDGRPFPPDAGSPWPPPVTFRRGRIDPELLTLRPVGGKRPDMARRPGRRSVGADGEPVHRAAEALGQVHLRLPAEVAGRRAQVGEAVTDVTGPRIGVLGIGL